MAIEMSGVELDSVDLSDAEAFRHGFPHDVFATARREAPVWRHPSTPRLEEIGAGPFWSVTTQPDIEAISHDPAHFRSFEGPMVNGWDEMAQGNMLIAMDPPAHTRLRRLVNAGFTPRMTAKLEEQARVWAVTIVEEALARGEVNFVQDLAYQLPMHMIADIVGVPPADRQALFQLLRRSMEAGSVDAPGTWDEKQAKVAEGMVELFTYAHDLADEKRRAPVDDVWSKLTTAEITQDDGTTTQLGELELDLFFMVLLSAGSETTRDAISAGLLALLDDPEQLELLRNDPGVMETAVEEIVRWGSPVGYFRRTAVEDIVFHGAEIKAGDPVLLWFPSANRDETVFADPFRFDLRRDPNPQVAFGGRGIHYCLGANLARREIRVLFEELLRRVGEIELLGEPRYAVNGIASPICSSLDDIPVRLHPR